MSIRWKRRYDMGLKGGAKVRRPTFCSVKRWAPAGCTHGHLSARDLGYIVAHTGSEKRVL